MEDSDEVHGWVAQYQHAQKFLGDLAVTSHHALCAMSALLKSKGNPSLGSILGSKMARTFLQGRQVHGIEAWRALKWLANGADALRHLTVRRLAKVSMFLETLWLDPAGQTFDSGFLDASDGSPCAADDAPSSISSCCAATNASPPAVKEMVPTAPPGLQLSHMSSRVLCSSVNRSSDTVAPRDGSDTRATRAAARLQAAWRGWALRTFAVDLRGAWPRLRAVYAVLARGRVVMDLSTGLYRARTPADPVRPR